MHTRSRIVSQVTRSAFSSVLLLQQIAALGPALANVPHNQVPSGPAPFHPNLTSSLLGNHAGWISGTPGHGDSGSGASNSPLLPASFGVGVASLPLARHSLPLVQHSNNVVQNIAGTKAVKQPVETVQLDMTASASTIVLAQGVIKHGSAVTIDVGGTNTTFHTGDKVTAAELVAIEQAQAGGQTLQLDGQGRASGGTFSLTSVTSNSGPISVASVIVPKNVTAIDQVSAKSSVNLSGDLTNYGSIDEVAKSNQAGSASLSALDIVNESTGLITSVGQGKGGVDLNLSAGKDFTNMGTITSSGALSIAADGTLSNTASGSGIIAVKDITLQSANIINGGTVASSSGNVNLTASASQNLNVNNAGGTISAVNGAINVRDAGYTGSSNTTIAGGNLLSQELNLSAGNGTTNVNVDQLTGTVSSAGNAVHVQAQTQDLILGPQHLSGDPTYYNDAVGGNIQITGDIVVTESLAIIANGSITATNGLTQITAINGAGTGQNITLVAGANITTGMGPTSSIATTPPVAGNATANVIFNGPSTGGGDINLTGASNTLSISSASTNGSSPGGSITLAAFSVSGVGGGHILLPSGSNIDASATAGNGNVAIIAGAQDGATAISINTVEHSGGAGAGTLQLYNVQPKSASGNPVTFDTTGAIQNGDSIVGDFTKAGNGSIQVGGALNASTSIDIAAGNIATLSSGATTNGPLAITAPGAITFGNNLTAPGGILIVSGGTVSASAAASLITSPASGVGGNIAICAGAAFTETAGSVVVTGASSSGGNVDLTNVGTINTQGTAIPSQGGTVNLVAYFNAGGGDIIATNTSIKTGGNGTGNNGDVILNAGATNFTAISSPASIDVTGGASGTGNVTLNAATPNSGITIVKATVAPSSSFTGATINQNATVDITPLTNFQTANGDVTLSGGSLTGGVSFPINYNSATKTFTVSAYNVDVPFIQNPNITELTISAFNSITCKVDLQAQAISMACTNGSIQISNSGFIKAPGGLTMVASGDIFTTGAGPSLFISTASTTGNAGNITIVAGAAFTDGSTITVTGSSGGGSVSLPNVTALNASSTVGKGGNVTLVSFNEQVDVGSLVGATSVITTGGAANFTNGNVTIVAGAGGAAAAINAPGAGININTTGGISGTGVITLSNSDPNATVASPVLIARADGTVTGNFLGKGPDTGTVYLGNLTFDSNTGAVQGGVISLLGTVTGVGTAAFNTDSSGTTGVSGSISANSISLASGAFINFLTSSTISAPAGISMVAAQDIQSQGTGGLSISTSQAGNAGNITIVAGAAFTDTLNTITVTGPSASGGSIDFASTPINSFTANSTVSGSGGNVTLVAFDKVGGGAVGRISLPTAVTITTGGAGGGANGNVVVVAGCLGNSNTIGAPGTALFNADTTGGQIGTGNITLSNSVPDTTVSVNIGRLSGTITQGNFLGGAVGGGIAYPGNLKVAGATISIQAGNNIELFGNITATNNSVLTVISTGAAIIFEPAASTSVTGSASFAAFSSINIDSNLSATGGITMVAETNINSSIVSGISISTSQAGNAGNITMVAGAAYSITGNTISVTGPSLTGGDIDFASTPISSFTANSTGSGSGGNVTLVAFDIPSVPGLGEITFPTAVPIMTGGAGSGLNGNVLVVAGTISGGGGIGQSPNQLFSANTTGGVVGTGNITLSNSIPNTAVTVNINTSTGAITQGNFLGGATGGGDVFTGSLSVAGTAISILAGNLISMEGTINATGNSSLIATAGTVSIKANVLANTASFVAPTAINIQAGVTAPGGISMVTGGQINSFSSPAFLSTNSSTGNAGDITLVAGAAFTSNQGTVTVTGSSGVGGDISFSSSAFTGLTAQSNLLTGSGGNITLVAFAGSGGFDGNVVVNGAITIKSGGGPDGSNGNVIVVAGNNSLSNAIGNGSNLMNIDTTGGMAGTGNITLAVAAPNVPPNVVISRTIAGYTGTFLGGALANGSSFTGTLNANNSTVTLSQGGSITANSQIASSGSNVVLQSGGTITVNAALNNNSITLDTSAGAGSIQVNSGLTAATGVTLTAGAGQTVNVTGDIVSPGGTVVINAPAGLTIGNINTDPGTTGKGGTVSVTVNTSTPLNLISTGGGSIENILADGGTTSGDAGSISVVNKGTGGILVGFGAILASPTIGNGAKINIDAGTQGNITLQDFLDASGSGANGNGGSITLNANSVNQVGGGVLLSAEGGSITGKGGGGAGGTITVTLAGSTPIAIGAAQSFLMSAFAGALGGAGGSISLKAPNAPLTVDAGGIVVTSSGNGNGGSISLTGSSITAFNAATQPLILTATGSGTGSGGTISLSATAPASSLTVGTANGNMELIANSGNGSGGAGGIVSVSAGGNLTVNSLGIVAGPAGTNGNGAQINLIAGTNGTGNLVVSSALSANGTGTGAGGEITLESNNSSAPFTIGSAKTNGVFGLSVVGTTNGDITVINTGGSITQTVAVTAVDSATYNAGGPAGSVTVSSSLGDPSTSAVTLTATGSGSITGTGTISASTATLNSGATGAIGGKTALKLAAGTVQANGGGQVNLSDSMNAKLDASTSTGSSFAFSSTGNIKTIGNVSGSTTVALITTATNGSITLGGAVTGTTTATVTAKGTGAITDQAAGSDSIGATTVNLTTTSGALGSGAIPLRVSASNLSALTTGNVNIDNLGSTALTLTGGKSTNAFTISSAGDINTGKVALTSASVINFITTANNGNIAVGASQGGTKTLGISLQADGSGNITEVKGVKLTSGATVGMVSATGSIGTSALPMVEVAPSISFNTSGTGAVFATNSYTKATTLQNSSAGAGFTLTSGSGGLTVNDISAGSLTNAVGSITLTATGGAIKTVAGTTQSNANGGITFNNTSTKGTIEFGANSNVTSFENTGGGTIEVVVGKLPPPQANNTPPSGVTAGGTTPLMIFFNNGLTAVGSNNANSENALLIFSAPSATLIKLDGGVTITADPLAPAPISPVSSQLAPAAAHTGPDRIVLPAIMAGQNEDGSSPSSNTTSPSVLTISGAENATTQNLAPMNGTLGSNSGVPYLTASSALSSSLLYSQDGTRTYFTGAPARAGWISDTELETGKIPAIIFGDVANALDDSVKSYADIETTDEGVVQNTIGATTTTAATKQSMATPSESALVGGISRTVRLIHTEKNSCRRSNLKKGSVLIASSTDSVINTPLGKVSIAARSLALVMSFSGGVAVFNLDDSHRDAVSISVGGNKIALAPGKSVVIASDATKSFDRINPAQLICYQGVTEHHLGNGMKVFKADFSLPSAINAVAPLKSLLQSNHPEAKRICGHLLKTTSIVMQLQGGFSNFYQIRRPQLTAYIR